MAELAISLPVLLLLVFGGIELGFMIKTKIVLQDAVRTALRYGSEAGTYSGFTDANAPACLADYATLDVIANRLQDSVVNTAFVRSVLIYAASDGSDNPQLAPSTTGLPAAQPQIPPHPGNYVYGDYYFADYDPSTGQDIAPSNSDNQGNGEGAIYRLFEPNGINKIFDTSAFAQPTGPFVDASGNPLATSPTPECGATLSGTNVDLSGPIYFDNSTGSQYVADANHGDWPPFWRNNEVDPQDRFGIDIVYDYQFKTPLFQFIGSLLSGSTHLFRMDERATFYLDPS